jgi:hypothetical protein
MSYRQIDRKVAFPSYSEALSEFKAAYLAKPDASFLFNIGQCQRQLGMFEAAAKGYRAFLR